MEVSEVEARFLKLRKGLDEGGYLESFGSDSFRLVEHLFNDLVKTTESLQETLVQFAHYKKIAEELEDGVLPFKEENVRLYRENSQLRMGIAKAYEEAEDRSRDPLVRLRELETENNDLKLLVSHFAERVKKAEVESLEKSKRIVKLQEKEATPSVVAGKKGMPRMEVDYFVPEACPQCIRLRNFVEYGTSGKGQKTVDYIKLSDSRIEALQLQLRSLKNLEKENNLTITSLKQRVDVRDSEIDKLRNLIKVRPGNAMWDEKGDRSIAIELKSAEMKLQVLQLRNIELEDKLKRSILEEHESYMLGKVPMPIHLGERNLANIILDKELDKYPCHDKVSLLEKLYHLEQQLSKCCKEKAALKRKFANCKLNHQDMKALQSETDYDPASFEDGIYSMAEKKRFHPPPPSIASKRSETNLKEAQAGKRTVRINEDGTGAGLISTKPSKYLPKKDLGRESKDLQQRMTAEREFEVADRDDEGTDVEEIVSEEIGSGSGENGNEVLEEKPQDKVISSQAKKVPIKVSGSSSEQFRKQRDLKTQKGEGKARKSCSMPSVPSSHGGKWSENNERIPEVEAEDLDGYSSVEFDSDGEEEGGIEDAKNLRESQQQGKSAVGSNIGGSQSRKREVEMGEVEVGTVFTSKKRVVGQSGAGIQNRPVKKASSGNVRSGQQGKQPAKKSSQVKSNAPKGVSKENKQLSNKMAALLTTLNNMQEEERSRMHEEDELDEFQPDLESNRGRPEVNAESTKRKETRSQSRPEKPNLTRPIAARKKSGSSGPALIPDRKGLTAARSRTGPSGPAPTISGKKNIESQRKIPTRRPSNVQDEAKPKTKLTRSTLASQHNQLDSLGEGDVVTKRRANAPPPRTAEKDVEIEDEDMEEFEFEEEEMGDEYEEAFPYEEEEVSRLGKAGEQKGEQKGGNLERNERDLRKADKERAQQGKRGQEPRRDAEVRGGDQRRVVPRRTQAVTSIPASSGGRGPGTKRRTIEEESESLLDNQQEQPYYSSADFESYGEEDVMGEEEYVGQSGKRQERDDPRLLRTRTGPIQRPQKTSEEFGAAELGPSQSHSSVDIGRRRGQVEIGDRNEQLHSTSGDAWPEFSSDRTGFDPEFGRGRGGSDMENVGQGASDSSLSRGGRGVGRRDIADAQGFPTYRQMEKQQEQYSRGDPFPPSYSDDKRNGVGRARAANFNLPTHLDKEKSISLKSVGVNTEDRQIGMPWETRMDDAQDKRQLLDKVAVLQRKLDDLHTESSRHQLNSFELQGELERTKHMLQVEKQERELAVQELRRMRDRNSETSARLLMNSGSETFRRGATPMEMEREIGNLRAALSSLDRDKDEMRVELDRKDEKLARVMQESSQYVDDISQLRLRLKNAELQINHTGESAKEQGRESEFLKKQVENNRRDLEKLIRERDDALKQLQKITGAHQKGQMDKKSLESELELKSKEADDLRKQVQRYIDEVRRIEELLLDKEEELEMLIQHYRALTVENGNLEVQRTHLEREASSIRDSVKDAVDQNITFKTQLASQNSLVTSLEEEIQRFTQQVSQLENQLSSRLEKEAMMEQEVKASKDLLYRLEVQMDKLKVDLADSESKRKQLAVENAELAAHIASLENRLHDETDRQQQLESLVATSREKDFQNERASLNISRERDELAEKLTGLQQRSETLSTEINRYRLKSIELQTELDRTRRQLDGEKRDRESVISELRRTREQLHSTSANYLLKSALGSSGVQSETSVPASASASGQNLARGSREQSPLITTSLSFERPADTPPNATSTARLDDQSSSIMIVNERLRSPETEPQIQDRSWENTPRQ